MRKKKPKKRPTLTRKMIREALAHSAKGVKDLEPGLRATFGPFKGFLS